MPTDPPPGPGSRTPGTDQAAPRIDAFVQSVEQTFPVLTEQFAADRPAAAFALAEGLAFDAAAGGRRWTRPSWTERLARPRDHG